MKLEDFYDKLGKKIIHHKQTPVLKQIGGVSIVSKYKYLGTYLRKRQ